MAGHPRNVETPEKMWQLFCEYAEQVKANPRTRTQFVGKDGNQVLEPLERPLTLEGFNNYCRRNGVGFIEQYFYNQDGLYEEYIGICRAIKDEIRQDQIEGGMVGQYNPSITQRLNGLTEKQENNNTNSGEIVVRYVDGIKPL